MFLRRITTSLCAIAAVILLAGSSFITSRVSGTPTNGTFPDRLLPGVYCPLNRDGDVATSPGACTRNWIEDGRFYSVSSLAEPDEPSTEFRLARLTRGATVMQAAPGELAPTDAGYQIAIAFFRENSFLLMPIIELTARDREAAPYFGVRYSEDRSTGSFEITGGSPEAVHRWLEHIVGGQLDRALREPELYEVMMAKSVIVIRVADIESPNERFDAATLEKAIKKAKTGLRFAITLE